jgi:hypothetical protein
MKLALIVFAAYLALLLVAHGIRHMEHDDQACRPLTADEEAHNLSVPLVHYICEPRAWWLP